MSEAHTTILTRVARSLAGRAGVASGRDLAAALDAIGGYGVAAGPLGRAVRGAGPLQPLVEAAGVTDVLVNGPDAVWIDRGQGLEPIGLDLGDSESLRELAVCLAARCGQRLDDSHPTADGTLPDGTRLHAALPPVARAGPYLSLRVPRFGSLTAAALEARGMWPPQWSGWLASIVATRATVLVTGATGTGKTTLLAALLSLVDQRERIVVIEQHPEIVIGHPHVVTLCAREPSSEGAGEVTMRDLVRQALRMRPDRIVVGEARGDEISDLLAALTTGHRGGGATLHAGELADVPARINTLGMAAGLPPSVVSELAVAAFDLVIHVVRALGPGGHYQRMIAAVGRPVRAAREPVGFAIEELLRWDGASGVRMGEAWPQVLSSLHNAAR